MFYSQFILAKKGPLGTIWVAAHLERKLRKNQVADTDIGDSVDSILQPEVPIALRLSSHLLLGVVRIYSRKVNYLFDDCSEALLKVKQAFRAADADVPQEETRAPFDSITLPDTFDLDDFELPDNEIFQGNNADHHTSTRDQITLQDHMDGVVYSSQFGLDDTFGDGETSSLNFDEGLVLHKEDTAGHAGASSDHRLSSPKQEEGFREMPANQESMEIENIDLERDVTDYAQAPSTPGLVETGNIGNVQEISACEDHMDEEDEDHPLVVVSVENSESIPGKSSHLQENAQLNHSSAPDDNLIDLNVEKRLESSDFGAQNVSIDGPVTASVLTSFDIADDEAQALGQAPNSSDFGEEHRNNLIDLNVEKRLYSSDFGGQNVSINDDPVTASRTFNVIADEAQALEKVNNLESDGVNGGASVSFKDHGEYSGDVISKESCQEASFSVTSLQLPRGVVSEDNQIRSEDMEVSRNSNRPVCSDGTLDLNFEHRGLSSVDKPENTRMLSGSVFGEMPHILRPCGTGLERADSSHNMTPPDVGATPWESRGGGERIHVSQPVVVVQDNAVEHNSNKNYTAGPGSGKSYNQGPEKQFLAPEKQFSVLDVHSNQPRDIPGSTRMFNGAVFNEMPRAQLHNLRPSRTGLELSDSSHDMAHNVSTVPRESPGGTERIHMPRPALVVQDDALKHNLNEKRTGSIQDIHSSSGKFYNHQVNNVVGGDNSMLKNVSGSFGAMFPPPVLDLHKNSQPRDLPEATPMFNGAVFNEMPRPQLHDMARDVSKDIHAGSGKSYDQVKNVVGSLSSVTSAPEKQWAVQDVHNNNQQRDLPENTRMFNGAVFDDMSRTQQHMLRPNVGSIPRESPGGWERRIHGSGPAVSVQDNTLERNLNENRTAGPGLIKDTHGGYGISYNQVNNFDSMFKNASGSPSTVFSAPEKVMSAVDVHNNNQPRDLPQDTRIFNGAGFDEMARTPIHIPSPYRTGLEHIDSSHPRGEVSNVLETTPNVGTIPQDSPPGGGWERFHVSGPGVVVQDNALDHNLNKNHHTVGPGSVNDIHASSGRTTYNQVNYAVGGDSMSRNVSGSLGPMYSAPETLMSVPDVRNIQPRDLPVHATPTRNLASLPVQATPARSMASLYENDVGSGINSWKKRSYTESTTPAEHSLNSVESARVLGTKRSGEAIRDDDGLSSILVGRGSSSVFQVNSTPPLPPLPHTMTSVKRQRGAPKAIAQPPIAPRASAYKRKVQVLMDDMLVLHGDIIRQQLINTSDIKRLRRKAPSMRPESNVILKLSLEEEIFGEPLCSGTSVVLASLFNQSYNIRRIKVVKDDVTATSVLSSSDKKFVSANETIRNDMQDHGEYEAVKNNAEEVIVLTEQHKLDVDNEVSVGPGITEMAFNNPTENKEEIEEPFSNVPSEAVDIAPMPSQDDDTRFDMGVNSGDNTVTVNEVESNDNGIRGSKNVTLDASSFENGSKRDVNDVRFDTVNSGVNNVTLNGVESNDNDISDNDNDYGNDDDDDDYDDYDDDNDNDMRLDTVNSGDNTVTVNEVEATSVKDGGIILEGEQSQKHDDACGGTSNEIKNDASKETYNEPLRGGSPAVTSLYPPGFTASGGSPSPSPSPAVTSLYPPGFTASGGPPSPAVTSLYPPGFTASVEPPSPAVTSLCPPGFGATSSGSPSPAVTSLYPPGFTASGGSPAVASSSLYPPGFGASGGSSPLATSLYPPGFADVQDSVLDGNKSPIQEDVNNPTNAVGAESCDDGKSPIQEDVNPTNAVGAESCDDGKSPIQEDVNPTNAVVAESCDDGKSPIQEDVNPTTNAVGAESCDDRKSPIQEDVDPTDTVVAEGSDLDTHDYNDIDYHPDAADDTGFLNDDDDDEKNYEVAEVADDDVPPNGEDTRFVDNSGWSSRTRAVATYLQTIFTREAEFDKKVVAIDNLLVGKTRKEACRMFFETLVLKTKDYIQVEQEGPFGHINVKPKMKLLKSDF